MHDEACHALIAAAHGWNGEPASDALKQATGAFFASAETDESLLSRISASLDVLDPGAAAWIAVVCGSAIERGANAELTEEGVLGLLRSWMAKLPHIEPEADEAPELTPEQAALIKLLSFVCQAAVSHLARLPARRETVGRDARLIERLDEVATYSHGFLWVREALLKSSGSFILLHPPSGQGLRLRYTNVSNCFHLFSLLQTAVGTRLEGGREPDESIARVARGKSSGPANDEAWWHYGNATSHKADLTASVWGEGLTREIPVVDGVQVILAWPPILKSRAWAAGFLMPHLEALPADVVVEGELSAAESAQWLRRLGIAAPRKWWRIW